MGFNRASIMALNVNVDSKDFSFGVCGVYIFFSLIPSQMSSNANIEALKIRDPPWAIPVSIIKSGFTFQIISCIPAISCGYWIMGLPNHSKLYDYLGNVDSIRKSFADFRSFLLLEFARILFETSE